MAISIPWGGIALASFFLWFGAQVAALQRGDHHLQIWLAKQKYTVVFGEFLFNREKQQLTSDIEALKDMRGASICIEAFLLDDFMDPDRRKWRSIGRMKTKKQDIQKGEIVCFPLAFFPADEQQENVPISPGNNLVRYVITLTAQDTPPKTHTVNLSLFGQTITPFDASATDAPIGPPFADFKEYQV